MERGKRIGGAETASGILICISLDAVSSRFRRNARVFAGVFFARVCEESTTAHIRALKERAVPEIAIVASAAHPSGSGVTVCHWDSRTLARVCSRGSLDLAPATSGGTRLQKRPRPHADWGTMLFPACCTASGWPTDARFSYKVWICPNCKWNILFLIQATHTV